MSYLNRFFDSAFDPDDQSKFAAANAQQVNVPQQQSDASTGLFELTQAIRPSQNSPIVPTQGFRHDKYVDDSSGTKVPVIMASVSRERLFETFMKLIQRLGSVVDVVLESSHNQNPGGHTDLYREHIDMPVLTSVLWDYEDLLMNDGCTGIAVLNPNVPQEIQFEEHKLLICYGSPLEPYEFILDSAGVTERPDIRFITESEHIHASSAKHAEQFERLRADLGLDGSAGLDSRNETEGFGDYGDYDSYGDSAGGLM